MHIENCGFGFNGDTCLPECKFGYAIVLDMVYNTKLVSI